MNPEPEEIMEARVTSVLTDADPGFEVVGALSPAPEGVEKFAPLSHIAVVADLFSQDVDWAGPGIPCAYTINVAVRVAFADDKTGARFRAACRVVRSTLDGYLGLNCTNFNDAGFECDDFQLSNTSTALDSDCYTKAYQLQVKGRYFPPTDSSQPETLNPT